MHFKNFFFIALLGVLFIACKQKSINSDENQSKTTKTTEPKLTVATSIYGNYVDDSYANRKEGYDWVAVSVKENESNSIAVSIRSRADKKRPTCTFDTKAYKVKDNSYESLYNGKSIVFYFSDQSVTISAKKEEETSFLNFFCSGGATIGGTYKKIDQDLDAEQIDPTSFSKILTLNDIEFSITALKKEGENSLTISSFGLEESIYNESFNIAGEQVVDAEVADLNSDGSPELFVYTQSVGSGSYGTVYGFSVNNKKSISQIYIQPIAENNNINHGYMGHDKFFIENNLLVQRFPIYNKEDINSSPTGGTRRVFYKLVDGEASRKLIVAKVLKD